MKNTILLFALLAAACTAKVDTNDFQKMDWLIGTWEGKAGNDTFYEHWTKVSDTELKNINFAMVNGDTANSHHASILVKDGHIIYKGDSELKATSLDDKQVTFENKEEKKKYIFRLDDQGRWIANLDNAGAKVEYQLSKTTPLDEMLKMRVDTISVDTVETDTIGVDSIE